MLSLHSAQCIAQWMNVQRLEALQRKYPQINYAPAIEKAKIVWNRDDLIEMGNMDNDYRQERMEQNDHFNYK